MGPNFTIVAPGTCDSNCEFCFWKPDKVDKKYMEHLEKTINSLPPDFRELSISGGEPTLSPYIGPILDLVRESSQFKKVVFTTNGINLKQVIPTLIGSVNHVNISRHHYDDDKNAAVFNSDFKTRTADELKPLIEELWLNGIDTTLSAVISPGGDLDSEQEVLKYLDFAKGLGVTQVFFRKEHGTLDPTDAEKAFDSIPSVEGECPACRTKTQIINGVRVSWKASVLEPSDMYEDDELYELVYHANGKLTKDWDKKYPAELMPKTSPRFEDIFVDEDGDIDIDMLLERLEALEKSSGHTHVVGGCGHSSQKIPAGRCGGGGGCGS